METPDNRRETSAENETYRVLDQQHDPPNLPGKVIVQPSADELIDIVCADLVAHAEQCVNDRGDFHLALSGGRTPQPLYERLMYDPDCRQLPWQRTHLWIVDERCVPFDDERSNFRMIRETIVEHADIPAEHVHPMRATEPEADRAYENEFKQAMLERPARQDRLDYVLLGMGTDGHTASLFPGSEALHEPHRLVRCVHHDSVDPPARITMTYNLINAARFIAVLLTGEGKAPMIQRLANENDSLDVLPIKGIAPRDGKMRWYLDAAACGQQQSEDS